MARIIPAFKQYFDGNGNPLIGGFLKFLVSGSNNTNKATYSDSIMTLPNTNPVLLDGEGRAPDIFGEGAYNVISYDFNMQQIQQFDPVLGAASSTVESYTNIAALQAIAIAPSITHAFIKGYYTDGDGGGGDFYWDSASTATDNGGTIIKATAITTGRWIRVFPANISSDKFGAKGDASTDDTSDINSAASATDEVRIPSKTHYVTIMPSYMPRKYIGEGVANISLTGSDVDGLKLWDGNTYDGIKFQSTLADLNSQRVDITGQNNVLARRCGFFDFKNPTSSNAWGVYISNSSDIVLDNCSFGGNTQSDIAIVDSNTDITIIHPVNTEDSGVHLNVEPNSSPGVYGLNVVGGNYREISLLENTNDAYSSQGIVVTGANVALLTYDGAGATFKNCIISSIVQEGSALTTAVAGGLMIDSLDLNTNLLTDPHLFDIGVSDTTTFWTVYLSSGSMFVKRFNDEGGAYTSLNNAKASGQVIVTTRDYITCTASESFVFAVRNKADYSSSGTNSVLHGVIEWYDTSNVLQLTTKISTCRAAANATTDWTTDVCIVRAPAAGAVVKFKVRLTTDFVNNSVSTYDVSTVGIYRYNLLSHPTGNMPEVIGKLAAPYTDREYTREAIPSGTGNVGGLVGDRIIKTTPVVGSPLGWRCTVAGTAGGAGTWVAEANL